MYVNNFHTEQQEHKLEPFRSSMKLRRQHLTKGIDLHAAVELQRYPQENEWA